MVGSQKSAAQGATTAAPVRQIIGCQWMSKENCSEDNATESTPFLLNAPTRIRIGRSARPPVLIIWIRIHVIRGVLT